MTEQQRTAEGLHEFLRARLDEDEAAQRGLNDWHARDCESLPDEEGRTFPCDCGVPARVLAEVEAVREVVRLAERFHDYAQTFMDGSAAALEYALRLYAHAYADHEDYREEWRP